jgi:O-glycosyl hydrolase
MVSTVGDIGRCVTVNGACGCQNTSGCTGRMGYDTNQYISFVNPDKSVVVVGLNAGDAVQHLSVTVDDTVVVANATLPPHSFNTFKVPAAHIMQH